MDAEVYTKLESFTLFPLLKNKGAKAEKKEMNKEKKEGLLKSSYLLPKSLDTNCFLLSYKV